MEFNKETALKLALDEYVAAFLIYQQIAEDQVQSDEEVLKAVLDFADEADHLKEFMEENFPEEPVVIPDIEVYFKDGIYHDAAYRIYQAVLDAGQITAGRDRNIRMLVYIGRVLRKHFMG